MSEPLNGGELRAIDHLTDLQSLLLPSSTGCGILGRQGKRDGLVQHENDREYGGRDVRARNTIQSNVRRKNRLIFSHPQETGPLDELQRERMDLWMGRNLKEGEA